MGFLEDSNFSICTCSAYYKGDLKTMYFTVTSCSLSYQFFTLSLQLIWLCARNFQHLLKII
jgi:hypothetical protein